MQTPSAKDFFREYLTAHGQAINDLDLESIEAVVKLLLKAYSDGKRVFIFGNGGSASIASHMACDLGKGTLSRVYDASERRLRVISLTDNAALLTAYANDLSFDEIFVQQLRNLVEEGDVVIAISGSGNSSNVIKGIEHARECGAKTVGLLGFETGGKSANLVDCAVIVKSRHYGPIESIHSLVAHLIASWFAQMKPFCDGNPCIERENPAVPFRND